jgi:hypothetical protein
VALDIAFIFNGFLGPDAQPRNLVYGIIICAGITLAYFLIHGMLYKSKDVVAYGCKAVVCASCTVLGQIFVMFVRNYSNDTLFYSWSDTLIKRSNFGLGWGVTTVIGAALVLGIPAAFYLARNCKFSLISYFVGVILVVGTFILDSRSSMLVGSAVLIVCMLLSCISGRNRVACRIYTLLILIVPVCALIYVIKYTDILNTNVWMMIRSILDSHDGDSGRLGMWKNGIGDFLSAPIFGIGFTNGGYEVPDLNVYSNMYHCIGIEFLGATGIVGCLAFLFHIIQLMKLFFRKFSIDKMLLMMIPAMIIVMSLVDNFFFYFNFHIFYGAFLAFAEISIMENKEKDKLITE